MIVISYAYSPWGCEGVYKHEIEKFENDVEAREWLIIKLIDTEYLRSWDDPFIEYRHEIREEDKESLRKIFRKEYSLALLCELCSCIDREISVKVIFM